MDNKTQVENIIKIAFRVFRSEEKKKKNLIDSDEKKKANEKYLKLTEKHLEKFYELKKSVKNYEELENICDKDLMNAVKDSKKIYNYINKNLIEYIEDLSKSKAKTADIKKIFVEEIYMNGMSKEDFRKKYLSQKNEKYANDFMRRYQNSVIKDVASKLFGIYGY